MKNMKSNLMILSFIGLWVFLPKVLYPQEAGTGPPPTPFPDQMKSKNLPIEQPLVPEGIFAIQLVEALKMGQVKEETQAESMLSAVGIEPKNGWIAGYPVTPPVIAEIEKGVAAAADTGKLGMGKDEALRVVGDLKIKMGVNVNSTAPPHSAAQSVPDSKPANTRFIYKYLDEKGGVHYTDRYDYIPKEYRGNIELIRETVQPQTSGEPGAAGPETEGGPYAANPGPDVINNYYYEEGPPVVTYYPPPDPYYYLYGWVPYPFWYSGFFFGGFFVLHDFHRHVFVNNHSVVVTNHVGQAFGGHVSVVNPVNRTLQGSVMSTRVSSSQAFNSSRVQSSARTIVGQSQRRMFTAGTSRAAAMGNVPGGRSFGSSSPRVSNVPMGSQGHVSSAPSSMGRGSFGGFRGGQGSFGGFHGGGGSFGGSHGGGGGHR
jgi:hypothetical protein